MPHENSPVPFFPLCALLAACSSPGQEPGGDSDIVWAVADGPQVVSEDVTVAAGSRLTIEAGVEVRLEESASIIVAGELIARGSEAQPILFTGAVEGQRWGSVVFEDTAVDASFQNLDEYLSGSILEHCTFEHARKALQLRGASPFVHLSTFQQNEADPDVTLAGGAAIYIEAGSAPRIAECVFTDNFVPPLGAGGAIYATDSDPVIQNNHFARNRSSYGGALATDLVASPIVGNLFEDNETTTEGGAMAVISTSSALLDNEVRNNHASHDGGGIHVCVDCFPHACPTIVDNTVVDNTSDAESESEGAAGVGAAFLRLMTDNNIHGNTRAGVPSNFGWYHHLETEERPEWVANRSIAGNWWGTTDSAAVDAAVFDGHDDPAFGLITHQPVRQEAVSAPTPRVTITTRKLHYLDAGDPMPVFLTVYNPGAERAVDLVVVLEYGQGAALIYQGPLDFPDAVSEGGSHALVLPAGSVYFSHVLAPDYAPSDFAYGHWHAALFDASSGERIGVTASIRFDLGAANPATAPQRVDGVGAMVAGSPVRVGDALDAVSAALGAPARVLDLGPAGVLFDYPDHHFFGLASGVDGASVVTALSFVLPFAGTLDAGIDLGGDQAAVEAALGGAAADPFLQSWWYASDGVAVQWNGATVERVHVF